jgi:excinuclease ABC subunit C
MKKYGEPYLFLQRIRDESHRAAISFHKKRRSKSFLGSALDAIPKIGEKRKAILLRHFKSISNIRAATIEELMAVPGMNRTAAMSVKKHLTA